jgi:hypothetical protein
MSFPVGKPQPWHQFNQRCSICKHPQVARIDYLAISGHGEHGHGRNAIAAKYNLSVGSLYNHLRKHISAEYRRAILAGPFASERDLRELAAEEGTSVLQSLRVIFNGHRHRWLLALEIGDDRSMIDHAKFMTNTLWKIGQLTQEILPTPVIHQNNLQINLFEHPEYVQAFTRLSEALQPFPDARKAVAHALRGLEPPKTAIDMSNVTQLRP